MPEFRINQARQRGRPAKVVARSAQKAAEQYAASRNLPAGSKLVVRNGEKVKEVAV